MMGSAAAVVAEIAGKRHLVGLDKGHRLEIRQAGGEPTAIEMRPVTEYSAAVDSEGRLHIAAWLLSRHLMYYTSSDGYTFTRSTLLKSDGGLRLKDCLASCDTAVSVVYVAETEFTDTLVCYRYGGGDWDGKRIVEAEHPQRLAAFQFDGAPGGACILYAVKEAGHSVVMSRPVAGDTPPEAVATVPGGLSDFCALTVGGIRQACWVADGHMHINGLRQTEEPWTRTWPCFARDGSGVQCLWLENGLVHGVLLGVQHARLRPALVREALPCMLALPGESRRAIVDAGTLSEVSLMPEVQERVQRSAVQAQQVRAEGHRGGAADLTLTDVVRNQAVYLTRMQESLGGIERNMLRLQSEVNRLNREVAALMRDRAAPARPAMYFAVGMERPDEGYAAGPGAQAGQPAPPSPEAGGPVGGPEEDVEPPQAEEENAAGGPEGAELPPAGEPEAEL